MIPVPGQRQYPTFRRFAADDEATALAPPAGTAAFPFFQYLLLSVSAGIITHYAIRALERKRK